MHAHVDMLARMHICTHTPSLTHVRALTHACYMGMGTGMGMDMDMGMGMDMVMDLDAYQPSPQPDCKAFLYGILSLTDKMSCGGVIFAIQSYRQHLISSDPSCALNLNPTQTQTQTRTPTPSPIVSLLLIPTLSQALNPTLG